LDIHRTTLAKRKSGRFIPIVTQNARSRRHPSASNELMEFTAVNFEEAFDFSPFGAVLECLEH
jgi:hypothetical protein